VVRGRRKILSFRGFWVRITSVWRRDPYRNQQDAAAATTTKPMPLTNYEKKLARYLIQEDIVDRSVLKHLIELRKRLESDDSRTRLDKILLHDDFITMDQLKRAKEAVLSSEPDPDPEASEPEPASDSSRAPDASQPADPQQGVEEVEEVDPEESTKEMADPGGQSASGTAERTGLMEHVASGEGDVPEPVPGYRVMNVLGKGGTGVVFEVEDMANDRRCALKMLYPHHMDEPSFVKRFRREGRLLTEFDHPNIVKGYDHGSHEQFYYQVLERIDGISILEQIQEHGALEEDRALGVILQVADALQFLQEQGIVHRDVKPDNVMLTEDGTARILDLGFAKEIGSEPDVEEGTTMGTVYYMSPEQAKGQQELDVRSDIYSLGVTLYHMVVGDVPFEGDEPREVMAKQVRNRVQGQNLKDGRISSHVHYFIRKMMSKKKDFRFQTPREIIDRIESIQTSRDRMEFHPEEHEINPFQQD